MCRKKLVCWLTASIIFLACLMMAMPPSQVYAIGGEPYYIEKYDIDVNIQADGSAIITERLMYRFERDTKLINFDINQNQKARLEISSVAISESDPPDDILDISKQDEQLQLQELSPASSSEDEAAPMTYSQNDTDTSERLRLNAFFAGGSSRLIKIDYMLEGLVKRSVDCSFIRQEIGGIPENVSVGCMKLKYSLPYKIERTDSWFRIVSETVHSSEQFKSDQWIIGWEEVKSGPAVEVVMIMPYDIFSLVAPGLSLPVRGELVTETEKQLEELESERFWLGSLRALVFFLLGLSFLFILLIFLIFDREGISKFKGKYLMPDNLDYPPAIFSILMRTSKPGLLLFSTLIDLVRRGELELDGLVFTWKNSERNDYTGFRAFEIFLLQWLFGQVGSGSTISTVQIRDYASDRKTSNEFNSYYDQFRQLINEEMPQFGLIDETKSRYGRIIGISLSAAYFLMGIVSSILLESWIGILLLIPSALFFLYGLSLRHLTAEGNEQYARGLAIKRYLGRFYELEAVDNINEELPACGKFVYALPYAIGLGKTKLFMRQMIQLAKKESGCGNKLVAAYHNLKTQASSSNVLTKEENFADVSQELSPAAKAAALEQLRLLGRDLVAMESMLLACFYFSSKLYLIEDH